MIKSIDRTHLTRGRVLVAVVLLSVVALSIAFTGSAAAAVDSAERDISSTEVSNGTIVTVTVDATFDSTTNAQINDVISPPVDARNVFDIKGGGTADLYQEPSGTISSTFFETDSPTLEYKVQIPADASVGTTYDFANGTVVDRTTGDEASITGDETITVIKSDGSDDDSSIGDGSIVTAKRTIDTPEAAPGDTVGVTVTAGFDGRPISAEITDTIPFKPDSSDVTDITTSGTPTISSYSPSSGEVVASWGSTTKETLSYNVKIPTDASAGTTYTFSGEVGNGVTTSSVTGDSTIEVVTDPLIKYANSDGIIESGGLLTAASEFRNGKIGSDRLLKVAAAFRTGKPVV